MARYTGPKTKIARRFRDPIFGPDKALDKRNYGPGQHGPSKRRGGKQSEYAIQLGEKQKAKYTYGILEKQFANMFEKASRMKGITGENLLQLCETRLDNTVYRLGVSPTRRGARQLVSHRHITVNGDVVNIPSYHVKPGDVIGVREKSKSLEAIVSSLDASSKKYDWLDWDRSSMSGKFLNQKNGNFGFSKT
ncbi:MAG: 30S ribosomal protein S4 [Flavobacteriia bacterium]|nr:30S ribosomal protein S4 [Flavobacteriia bacterium]